MYKFFAGTGELPDAYLEVFICNTLGITYTELISQPDWWVEKSMEYMTQKAKFEQAQQKLASQRAKSGRKSI